MDKKDLTLGFAAVFLVGAGLGGYFFMGRRAAPAPAPAAAPAPEAVTLPSIEESSLFLREKAAALSADPGWAAWLGTEDPLRRAAAAIDLLSAGKVPKDALVFLGPSKAFTIKRTPGTIYPDPAGYARYDRVAQVVSTIDARAAAALLKTMSPLFEQACREFGGTACDYPAAFARAAGPLIETPTIEERPRLKPSEKGISFVYVDERLEKLTPAQKQLLRMGPRNAALLQTKLRAIVEALALPGR